MDAPAISKSEFLQRQERARALARDLGLEALLVVGRSFYDRPGHLGYLTNYFPPEPTMVFGDDVRGAGHGILVLPVKGAPVLITSGANPQQVAVEDIRPAGHLGKTVVTVLEERRLTSARVGVVGADIMPLALYLDLRNGVPAVDWVCMDPALDQLRRVKSPAEQEVLRQAVALADRAHAAALNALHPGATESEVCAAGTAAALAAGADFVRYFRVHAGEESAISFRWPQARPVPIQAGDMVTMDVIGAHRGYGFDILRTTVVGTPTAEQRRVLESVLTALEAALATLRAGVTVDTPVRAALGVLEEAGYGQHARTFVGHGIGLETVELPYLVPGDTTPLQAGEVLCVEPKVAIPGWGGASIENQVIVTDEGYELLDHTPRRLWS